MVWRAGGFGGAGKRRTLFSVLFIAFLGPAVRRLGRLCWAWRGRCSPLALDPTVPQLGSGWVIFEARGFASLSAVAVFGAGSCCAPRRSSLSAPRSLDARGGAPTFCPLGGHPLSPPAAE